MHLVVDGETLWPLSAGQTRTAETIDQLARFVIPDGAVSVRLASRRVCPAETRPWVDDPRKLGVAVRSVLLRDRTGVTAIGADHPALTDGWHGPEYSSGGACWRWTNGDAALPIVSDGPCVIEISLSTDLMYFVDPCFDDQARVALDDDGTGIDDAHRLAA